MRSDIRSINCPSCGAGQSVLGGGRVRSVICIFCGATLDAANGFEAIRDKVDLIWPETPLEIGMTGKIHGVEATVIGVLEMVMRRSEDGAIGWRWVDHQIYSPTHGYAWLSWEKNWLTFSRKSRIAPTPGRISHTTIENSESRPDAQYGDETFAYYDSGVEEIAFAAGAFNFTPRRGHRSFAVNMLGEGRMLSYVDRLEPAGQSREIEWETSELLDRDATLASFGVDSAKLQPVVGYHPLKPFRRAPIWNEVRNLAAACAAVCFIAALIVNLASNGDAIAQGEWSTVDAPIAVEFEVTDADRLVALQLQATQIDNAWAWFDLEVTDAEDEVVFEVERGIEYYHGYQDGAWTEGSRTASVYFKLPAPGVYRAEASIAEQGLWRNPRGSSAASEARLTASERISSSLPLLLAGLGCLLVAGGLVAQRSIHNFHRWRGSDWSDE